MNVEDENLKKIMELEKGVSCEKGI